jgi:hypothetical protein
VAARWARIARHTTTPTPDRYPPRGRRAADRIDRKQKIFAHRFRVWEQPEERHLSDTAETDRNGNSIEPLAGSRMTLMPVCRDRDPDVNVGKACEVNRECHRSRR